MGLDWNPMSRPKPGYEADVDRILSLDLDSLDEAARVSAIERFQQITEAPYETLGAPRVGHDSEANAWLLSRLKEQGRESEYGDVLKDMHGYYVLDLLPDSPGLPVYSSAGYDGVDRYTFRAKFLDDVEAIIGEELYHRAWARMSARELLAYGSALLTVARAYAREHRLTDLEHRRLPPDADEDTPESNAHILFSAARWCIWWAERGHGLDPYY